MSGQKRSAQEQAVYKHIRKLLVRSLIHLHCSFVRFHWSFIRLLHTACFARVLHCPLLRSLVYIREIMVLFFFLSKFQPNAVDKNCRKLSSGNWRRRRKQWHPPRSPKPSSTASTTSTPWRPSCTLPTMPWMYCISKGIPGPMRPRGRTRAKRVEAVKGNDII